MKTFWGYKDEDEARKHWGKIIDLPIIEDSIPVVDDPAKWPQTSSRTVKTFTVELPNDIISWSE